MSITLITINATDVEEVARNLAKLTGEALDNTSVAAINLVTKRAYDSARQLMNQNINLSQSYIDSQMDVRLATLSRKEAVITAKRDGVRGTTLAPSYGAQLITKEVNWRNEEIIARGHTFGKWTDGKWTRRDGNRKLGIPAGRKADGFAVSVKRGELTHFRKSQSGDYYSFLAFGKNGILLAFSRQKDARGRGSLRVLRGPAPWQLFRSVIPRVIESTTEDLQKTLITEVDNYMRGIIR